VNLAMLNDAARFVQALPVARQFAQGLDDACHASVPDDWFVAATDVVGSRDHITRGRYKEVNMAGVALISAAMNELGFRDVPYAFGGDGAALALGLAEAQAFDPVLGRVLTTAHEGHGLDMRGARVPAACAWTASM
jgi:hypothetical protein